MGIHSQADPQVRVFADPGVWLEGRAVEQLTTTARLPHIRAAVGLPDLHPGRGYPVGAAFFSVDHFYPALVGGDIGCGMSLWRTDLPSRLSSLSRLEKQWGNIDGPLPERWQDAACSDIEAAVGDTPLPLDPIALRDTLGTIGGGNHFAELMRVETRYADDAPLADGQVCLLVHSGSRGLGGAILRDHIALAGHAGLHADSAEAERYLAQHAAALRYAEANRRWIAQRIVHALRCEAEPLLDVSHNHVLPATWRGEAGFLHRKGATPADCGTVVIPGSRGDYSYLVEPLAGRDEALHSLAHGAGRKWARSDCEGRLSGRFKAEDLRRTRFGSVVVCADKALLFEEAPQAYKSIDAVVTTLVNAGLVRLLARMAPVLTYKKRRPACC